MESSHATEAEGSVIFQSRLSTFHLEGTTHYQETFAITVTFKFKSQDPTHSQGKGKFSKDWKTQSDSVEVVLLRPGCTGVVTGWEPGKTQMRFTRYQGCTGSKNPVSAGLG